MSELYQCIKTIVETTKGRGASKEVVKLGLHDAVDRITDEVYKE